MDMERAAATEDEIVDKNDAEASAAAPTLKKTRKRKRPAASDPWSVVRPRHHILARLPARTATPRSRARPRRHRSLIRGPEFSSFYSRLGKPVPRPHVAYIAAAQIKRRPEHEHPTSGYFAFRTAGEGLNGIGDTPAPMTSLAGYTFLGKEYVNTCNGVLLLASKGFSDPCRCTLWNPPMCNGVGREVHVPKPPSSEKIVSEPVVLYDDEDEDYSSIETLLWNKKTQLLALGLGCGKRSNTYKLLLCRKVTSQISRSRPPSAPGKQANRVSGGPTHHIEYSLVVHSLSSRRGVSDMPVRTVLPMETVLSYQGEVVPEIMHGGKSVYMDGTIYFLYLKKHAILAFDVDNEKVRTIDMLNKREKDNILLKDNVLLIEMYGRPCLAITTRDRIALWLVTDDYQLEPIHVISYKSNLHDGWRRSILGVWDCGSVLVLCLEDSGKGELLLYDVATKKIFKANLPGDFAMKRSEYMICWGYKRTLQQPRSIVGERCRGRWKHITEVVNPLIQQDIKKGEKAALNTACLMEFMARIMENLPHDLQYVLEMPPIDSEEPDLLFQNVV